MKSAKSVSSTSIKIFILCLFLLPFSGSAQDTENVAEQILGVNPKSKFSFHEPSYFIFGDDDLKLQFSFKYKLLKEQSLYFAYSQLMFWDIYEESKPFEDVNYKPEVFYRILEEETSPLKSLDFGYLHTSNGQKGEESRSLDRLFARANFTKKFHEQLLGASFRVQQIYNEDDTNKDIVNHLGYWELSLVYADMVLSENQRMNIHFRTYAGSQVFNVDQGAIETGLLYRRINSKFNPSIYYQWFEGYAESLIAYNKKRSEHRLGIMLSF